MVADQFKGKEKLVLPNIHALELGHQYARNNFECPIGIRVTKADKVGDKEAERCLNCDVQTVFDEARCIECDACVDICPTDCISFVGNAKEEQLRNRLTAPAGNLAQDLYVSADLPTTRVMVKDENVCLHCGLCAERCPTTAWDMQKFLYNVTKAGQ